MPNLVEVLTIIEEDLDLKSAIERLTLEAPSRLCYITSRAIILKPESHLFRSEPSNSEKFVFLRDKPAPHIDEVLGYSQEAILTEFGQEGNGFIIYATEEVPTTSDEFPEKYALAKCKHVNPSEL